MRNVLERLLNLLAFLLTADRPVRAEEIRHTVAGYDHESDEAFRRMFERDKDLLRRMGIPLLMRPTDAWEVEFGYVVPPEEYRLPDPGLTDEELAALWLAAQVIRIGGRPAGPEPILKLGGARLTAAVEPLAADLGESAERLGDVFQAVTERRTLELTYRGRRRAVEPHGLGHHRGHWYLVALETGERRTFRLDRAEEIRVGERPDAFVRRDDLDVREALEAAPWETGGSPDVTARIRFDPDVAWWAVRRLPGDRPALHSLDGSLEVELPVSNVDAFLGWVLAFGEQAEVLGPEELRARLLERVRGSA